ncbi:hypothetical protein ACVWZW_000605 [Bradyrhizobium sp. F1.13.4]
MVVVWFGLSWSRQKPDGHDARAAADLREQRARQNAVGSALEVGRIQQRIAERELRAVLDGNLHQPTRDVDGVARRRDVLVAFAEARGDDRAEMRADLEAELIPDRRRQRRDPAFDAAVQVDRAFQRACGVVGRCAGQTEQDHGAVAEKAADHAAAIDRGLLDQRVKRFQNVLEFARIDPLAERREAREIDEDHGCVLPDGFRQEIRIARQPLLHGRRLELRERPALGREILRAAASRPQLHAGKDRNRRYRCGERGCGVQPDAVGEREQIEAGPGDHHRGRRDDAERAAPPGEQADQQHRQQDRDQRVGDVDLAVAHDAVAGDEVGDRGGDHFDAGHQGIEWRRVEITAAGDRGADHDDAVLDRGAFERAVEDALRADGADGPARPVIGNRQREVAIGGHRAVAEHQMVRRDRQRLVERPRRDPQRE